MSSLPQQWKGREKMVRLRAGESFRAGEERRRDLLGTKGKRAAANRSSAVVHKKSKGSGSAMPASGTRPTRAAAAAAGDATVEDIDARKKSKGSGSSDAATPASRKRPEGAAAAAGNATVEGIDAHKKSKGSGSSDAATPASRKRPGTTAAAAGDATVEDTDALDCGVCFLPLKPPIFQCDEGHVVCSPCRDKLAPAGKCHVCGIATPKYHRCHAMERLVESVRVPCPNAAHGCGARPAYYDQHGHSQTCPHVPHRCPGKDCSFLGSTEVLLNHFTGAHGWPSTTKISAFETCSIPLYDGFNFILADHDHGITTTSSSWYLFLLNVTRRSLGCSITVHFIGQESPSEALRCVLSYARVLYDPRDRRKFLGSHSLKSEINVECLDLSNGLPDPDKCFQFVVPDSALRNNDKKDTIDVEVHIGIINLE